MNKGVEEGKAGEEGKGGEKERMSRIGKER